MKTGQSINAVANVAYGRDPVAVEMKSRLSSKMCLPMTGNQHIAEAIGVDSHRQQWPRCVLRNVFADCPIARRK